MLHSPMTGKTSPLHLDQLQVQSATFDVYIQVSVAGIGINKKERKNLIFGGFMSF